jgi:hypothetical protein
MAVNEISAASLGEASEGALQLLYDDAEQLSRGGNLTEREYREVGGAIRIGMYSLPAPEGEAQDIILKLQVVRRGIRAWPQVDVQSKLNAAAARISDVLAEDLATVTLRRVLPGKCRYCPDGPITRRRRRGHQRGALSELL